MDIPAFHRAIRFTAQKSIIFIKAIACGIDATVVYLQIGYSGILH